MRVWDLSGCGSGACTEVRSTVHLFFQVYCEGAGDWSSAMAHLLSPAVPLRMGCHQYSAGTDCRCALQHRQQLCPVQAWWQEP